MAKKAGLKLTREVSLKVDWLSFAEKMFKAVTEGFKAFNGDFKGGVESVFALVGAAKSVKQDIPTGARALELILLCFAWPFDALRSTNHLKEDEAKEAARAAIDALKGRVETGKIQIPYDFFEQPEGAEPYQLLRDEFLRNRLTYRPSGAEDEAILKARFDSAFRSAVWEIWSDRGSAFEELAGKLASPAAKTADFERQWRAYRESLISEFHVTPVFGQEETRVSLGQLYVPLRCFWREVEMSEEDSSRYVDERSGRKQILYVKSLQAELDEWLDNGDSGDWLRLIGGGPGSGKSTSARAFAARVAERENLRPIFVPLQRLKGDSRLRESINGYFRDRSGCPFQIGPIERKYVENGPPMVLIFDGLDEIARPGESADNIARDMMDWIRDLHTELTGETNAQHRVLVTGRMPSFQAARRRVNRKGREALEVLGFLPFDADARVERGFLHGFNASVDGNNALIEADDRELWWARYGAALGRAADLPAGLKDPRLDTLTAEPLLCYLLALSGYLEGNSEEAAENRNRVYERLLHDVWERGWGAGRAGPGKDLPKEDFDRLFETMALAAWHGGDERVATHERFERALKVTRAAGIFDEFRQREGGDVSNLAVNFYLRRPEEDARGFEFTHKSFGEYLAARALIRAAIGVAELARSRIDVALDDWLAAVADGDLSYELLEFLKDEARLMPHDRALPTLRSLETMMSDVIAHGLPAHKLQCETWRQAEERQRKAETLLMTLLHCVSMNVASISEEEARIGINWHGDSSAFGNLLHRIRRVRNAPVPALSLFCYLDLPNTDLLAQDLLNSNFLAADLEGSWGYGAQFGMVDLDRANLRHAQFPDANFRHARLRGAKLGYASLEGASLEGANLEGADLQEADLQRADLRAANLRRANLEDANLEGAILVAADLERADLRRAKLEGADFKGAYLKGTRLEGVEGANLEGAVYDRRQFQARQRDRAGRAPRRARAARGVP